MMEMVLSVCCVWAVLLCPSVEAYGNVNICLLMNKYHIFVLIKCLTLDEVENIRAKGAQSVHVYGKEEENHLHFIAVHEK